MPGKTEICNFALAHLGVSKPIGDIETDKSASAQACRVFFDISNDETFRDFNWPFATIYLELGLVEETPNTNWDYSYRYPSDCSNFRKILSSIRNDNRQTRVSYEIASDSEGRLIFTDRENAIGKYTSKIVDTNLYSADYTMMLSLLLASYIAPRVTAGDPFGLGSRAFKLYVASREKAQATAFNEQQDDENPEAESVRVREDT